MKKKKFLLLALLSTFALAGCGETEPSTSNSPASDNPTSTTPEVKTHAVVLPESVKGAHIYASKMEAAEGEAITLTVVLTDNDFALNEVAVNGTVLTAAESEGSVHHFNFLMGEADANVTVKVTDLTEHDHMITFEGNGLAFPIDLPDGANIGDTVSFKVTIQSGNELQSVKVMNGEEEVELTGNPTTGYSFVMPDADVTVVANTIGGYFRIAVDTSEVVLDEEANIKYKNSDFFWGFINEDGESKGEKSAFVRAGETAKVIVNTNYNFTATHFYANNVEFFKEENNETNYKVYTFTMPGENVTLKADAAQKKIALNVDVDTDVVDFVIYNPSDETKAPVTEALPGTKLNIEAKVKEAKLADFALRNINGGYKAYSTANAKDPEDKLMNSTGNEWSNTQTTATFAYVDENTKSFTVPKLEYWSEDALTIKLALKDMHLYEDEDFIGTWTGFEYYSYKRATKEVSTTIDAGGDLISDESKLKSSIAEIVEPGHIKLADGRDFLYDGNIAATQYSNSSSYVNFSDCYILAKRTTEGSTFTTETYSGSTSYSNGWYVTMIYENIGDTKTLLGTAFYDETREAGDKFMLNVEVELTSGDSIKTANATIDIKKNGETIKTATIVTTNWK